MTLYYRPLVEEQGTHVLAGGWCRFSKVEVLSRQGRAALISADEVPQDILHRLTSARSDLGTKASAGPQVMGILNTTPDSFFRWWAIWQPCKRARPCCALAARGGRYY